MTLAARPLTGRWRIIDACLAAATLIAVAYLVVESESIIMANWFSHPLPEKFLATILFAALMESIRRALGLAFVALICLSSPTLSGATSFPAHWGIAG